MFLIYYHNGVCAFELSRTNTLKGAILTCEVMTKGCKPCLSIDTSKATCYCLEVYNSAEFNEINGLGDAVYRTPYYESER